MYHILKVDPWIRLNDKFITNKNLIHAEKIEHDVRSDFIIGGANDTRFHAAFYQNFALDIVSETVFHYPYPCITEKTLRPICEKRMFIILGPYKILDYLKSIGFETFSDIINEDYDNIQDPELRFLAVVDSVKKFCDIELDIVKNYMIQNKDKFEHNFNLLSNYRDLELTRLNYLLDNF